MRLIRALRDCKQRSLTVSKKALTVSKKASPILPKTWPGISDNPLSISKKVLFARGGGVVRKNQIKEGSGGCFPSSRGISRMRSGQKLTRSSFTSEGQECGVGSVVVRSAFFGVHRFSVQRPPNPYFEGFRSDLGQKSGAPQTQIQRRRIQRAIPGPLIKGVSKSYCLQRESVCVCVCLQAPCFLSRIGLQQRQSQLPLTRKLKLKLIPR